MMRLFGVLLCLAITVPVPAWAQVAYKRWDEIFTPQYTKPLPPGYFDFVPVAPMQNSKVFRLMAQYYAGIGATPSRMEKGLRLATARGTLLTTS
jgi:hypothetical protein